MTDLNAAPPPDAEDQRWREAARAFAIERGIVPSPAEAEATGAKPDDEDPHWREAARRYHDDLDNATRQSLYQAHGTDPDQYARVKKISEQFGVHPDTAAAQLPELERRLSITQNAARVGKDSFADRWLADQVNAKLASDDLDQLDLVSRTWKAFRTGATKAVAGNQRGRLGSAIRLGEAPDLTPQIEGLERTLQATPTYPGAAGYIQKVGGVAGGILDNFLHATEQASQGAAIGAMAGTALPGIGTGVGAAAGAGIGFGQGIQWDMGRIAAGNAYLDLQKLRDQAGQPLEPGLAETAAVLVGLGTYALGGLGVDQVTGGFQAAASRLLTDTVKEAVTRPATATALRNLSGVVAKAGVGGALIMSALEGTALFGPELAKQLSAGDWQTVFNDPVTRHQLVDRLTEAAVDGATLFPLLHLPEAGLGLYADALRARQARTDIANFQALETAAAGSKTRTRALDRFHQYLQHQAEGEPVDTLFIPADKVRELYQSYGVDPFAFEDNPAADPILGAVIPDAARQLRQALATDGDIEIPTAAYVAKFAGTEIADRLRGDLRVRPDGQTLNEADRIEANRSAFRQHAAGTLRAELEAGATAAEPGARVEAAIYQQLREAGKGDFEARQQAALAAARYETRAARFNNNTDQPEPVPDTTRFYYKGEAYSGSRSRWLLPDMNTAKKYRDQGSLYYVDIPNDTPLARDPDGAIEAPAALARQLRPLPEPGAQSPFADAWAAYQTEGLRIEPGLPASLAQVKVDINDVLIEALRKGTKPPTEGELYGPSLLQFIKERGGITDPGGDLRAMDLHKARRGLVLLRDLAGKNEHDPDDVTRAAWEAGYFPELGHERPTPDHLFEAIRQELAGTKRYAESQRRNSVAEFHDAVADLAQFLDQQGIDLKSTSNQEIKALLAGYGTEDGQGGWSFHQPINSGLDLSRQVPVLAVPPVTEAGRAGALGTAAAAGIDTTPVRNRDTGWTITLSKNKLDDIAGKIAKSVSHRDHVAALRAIRSITEHATLVDSHADTKGRPDVRQVHRLFSGIDIDGRRYAVKTTVLEYADGRRELDDGVVRRLHEQRLEKELPAASGTDNVEAGASSAEGPPLAGASEGSAPRARPSGTAEPGHTDATISLRDLIAGIKDTATGQTYAQAADAGQPRGSIRLSDGAAIITLFRDANKSTLLHEFGHLWLDELQRDAAHAAAPEGLRADWHTVRTWLGAEEGQVLTTEQHERWARGFEAYLMEGKAPSPSLAAAFRAFKVWLTKIYRTVRGLNAPINDEIRAVMDRLLATDEAIGRAKRGAGLDPLFADAKAAGMNPETYRLYQARLAAADAEAEQRALDRVMAALRKERTQTWQAEEAAMRAEVARELGQRPDLRAEHYLRTGQLLDRPGEELAGSKLKLDRGGVIDLYGSAGVLDLLPRGLTAKDGLDPHLLAELLGYPDGHQLIDGLMSLEAQRRAAVDRTGRPLSAAEFFDHLVETETRRRMLNKHGDVLADGSIEEAAREAVHHTARAKVLATELEALAAKNHADPPYSLAQLQDWVRAEIADMPVNRATNPNRYRRAELAAAREAETAVLKGDWRTGFAAKQRQLLNHLLVIEADRARTDVDGAKKLFRRYAKQREPTTIAAPYWDRIHQLLARFGYMAGQPYEFAGGETIPGGDQLTRSLGQQTRKAKVVMKRHPEELARATAGETLEGFVNRIRDEGADLAVAPWLFQAEPQGWVDDLTMGRFRDLHDAVKSLAHVGRNEHKIADGARRAALEDLVKEAVTQLKDQPQRAIPAAINPGTEPGLEGLASRTAALLRNVDASLLKIEQVMQWLDRREPSGVFTRVVFRRLKEAQHAENDRLLTLSERIKELGQSMPEGWSRTLSDYRAYPELVDPRTGAPFRFRKKDIIAIALNTGSKDNLRKLLTGYQWSESGVRAVLDRVMTKADWEFVQGVWDTFESMRPEIDAMVRRVSGVGMDLVEASPVVTPHGTFRGGYYPLRYDPTKSQLVKSRHAKAGMQLFENDYTRAGTVKGHTLSRVEEVNQPVWLSLDLLPHMLRQAVHDLTHREAILETQKFLLDPRVLEAVDATLGAEYAALFRPWLQGIANDASLDQLQLAGIDAFLRTARTNLTVVGIGFRVTTVLKHGLSALSMSVGELGPHWSLVGARQLYGAPEGRTRVRQMILDKSGELRHRVNSIDRDIRDGLREVAGELGPGAGVGGTARWLRREAAHFGHLLVAHADMESALFVWLGSYRKALGEGMAEPDAVYRADQMVRNAHGAQGAMDLAAIQRAKNEWMKLCTMFYGFFNHNYNRLRDTGQLAGEGLRSAKAGDYAGARRDFALVMARSWTYLVIPALVEAWVSEGVPDTEEEGWLSWFGHALVGQVAGGVPVLRDAAKAVLTGRKYEMSPAAHAVDALIGQGRDIADALGLTDHELSDRWLRHAIETPGYILGLPTGQPAQTIQYLWELIGGRLDQPPENAYQFLQGLAFGPPHAKH